MTNNANKGVRIIPLGGLGEIGLNCMLFEYDDEIIVVDCGVMFSDLQLLGVDFAIPDMAYLKKNKDKIAGYVITHAHEDHIGALPFAIKSHPAPIFCSKFASKLIHSKLDEHGLSNRTDLKLFTPGDQLEFKHFKVKIIPVNHSIVEAMALEIDTPIGKIIFTGDFKMDVNPYYGKPFDNRPFETAGKNGVLLLMSDSTNVERDGHSISEETLFQKFEDIFIKSTGLTVVSVFASNIARIGQIFELAHKLGKKIALMGRSMEQNVAHAFELGYLKHYHDVIIPIGDLASYNRKDVILISTGSQGEYRSGLSRLSQNENKGLRLVEGDLVVLSSKFIPGNEKAIGKMINNLFRLGIDVLYEAISDIHVSGHANAEELLAMITMTKPKFFMPVHGEYRHLVKHRKLALTANIEKNNAVIAVNGDVWELTQDSLKKIDEIEENRVLIEGEGGNDVSQVVIKDRRKVAESGIVFSILIRNAITNQIIAGPDLIAKGFLEGENQTEIFESAKKVVHTIISESEKISSQKQVNLQEEIRIGLRRFFNSRVGKKPVVLPIIIDV